MHTKPFELYSLADSAVDIDAMGVVVCGDYMRQREPALLKFVPGKKPTVFVCSDIPASVFSRYVMAGDTDVERNRRAFQAGVIKVRNLVSRIDGEKRAEVEPEDAVQLRDRKIWADDRLDLFAPVYQQEIGSVLLMRSAVPFGSSVTYPPPPLLLSVYLARCTRSAGKTPDGARPPSGKGRG